MSSAIATIKRQRMLKMAGVMSGFFAFAIALFSAEAAMLSQEQAPDPLLDPQPGEFAPLYPD